MTLLNGTRHKALQQFSTAGIALHLFSARRTHRRTRDLRQNAIEAARNFSLRFLRNKGRSDAITVHMMADRPPARHPVWAEAGDLRMETMALPFNAHIRTPVIVKWFEQTNRGPSANARFLPIPGGPRAWPFASIGTTLPFRPFGRWVVGTPRTMRSHGHPQEQATLTTDGRRTIKTGRYEIALNDDGKLSIYDSKTRTWLQRASTPAATPPWDARAGDLALELPDGATVVLRAGERDAAGASSVRELAVVKGEEAVLIVFDGDGKADLQTDTTRRVPDAVGDAWDRTMPREAQGTARLSAASARELIGVDPNAGRRRAALSAEPGAGRTQGVLGATDGVVWSRLEGTIERLQGQVAEKVALLEQKMGGADGQNTMNEVEMQRALFEIQQLQDAIRQIVTAMTNMLKADHESRMAIARNLA